MPPARSDAWRLFALSFMALFLELMVIRWVPGSIKLVAYYANLMLISSFLGLGLGAVHAERNADLLRWFPSLLALDVLFLGLCRNVLLPGSATEVRYWLLGAGPTNYIVLLVVFILNTALFVPLGEQIGRQFQRLPNLRAYAWDLGGSLAGTLVFGVFAVLHFSPQIGLAVTMVLFGMLFPAYALKPRTLVLLVLTLALSVVATERRATWSAYSYLTMVRSDEGPWRWNTPAPVPPPDIATMRDPPAYGLMVNQQFYQQHRTNDLRRYTPGTEGYRYAAMYGAGYQIPYAFHPALHRVAVVAGGGGLDVEAALLHGADHVDVDEIDPAIVQLARRYSAAGVYDNPRVTTHIDDARAFFERATPGYDLIVFGLLDSHALFSSMANIRLDGFVYTVEGIRRAWNLLDDRGVLAMSFATSRRPWLQAKLYGMVTEATGREPRAYARGRNFVVLVAEKRPIAVAPDRLGEHVSWKPPPTESGVPLATDDWPYLYLARRTIPSDYVLVIGTLIVMSIVAVARLKPPSRVVDDVHFGALGMGFLLLETKSIVDSSLYFGATWLVSLIVIAGVLVMVLLANAVAGRRGGFSRWLYAPLFASIILVFAMPSGVVLGLPFDGRILWTLLAVPIPVFFAGLVFSGTFKQVAHPSAAFGANLVGAMLGGFTEYLSMVTGRRFLVVIIAGAYLVSLTAFTWGARRPGLAAS
jgi:predicted membrane-bound spermidine synthase